MRVMSTKEEWLYRLIIDNVRLKPRPQGEYYIDILLSGVPKDKYDTKTVLKVIGDVQGKASEILDTIDKDFTILEDKEQFEEIQKEIQERLKKHYFNGDSDVRTTVN